MNADLAEKKSYGEVNRTVNNFSELAKRPPPALAWYEIHLKIKNESATNGLNLNLRVQ